MPKASIMLPDGTKIEIDGTLDEVQRLTEHYGRAGAAPAAGPKRAPAPPPRAPARNDSGDEAGDDADTPFILHLSQLCFGMTA